jgi:hypothetical protein
MVVPTGFHHRLPQLEYNWTSNDQAVYAKWRQGVLVIYGFAGLVLLTVLAAYRPGDDGRTAATVASTATPPAITTARIKRP